MKFMLSFSRKFKIKKAYEGSFVLESILILKNKNSTFSWSHGQPYEAKLRDQRLKLCLLIYLGEFLPLYQEAARGPLHPFSTILSKKNKNFVN